MTTIKKHQEMILAVDSALLRSQGIVYSEIPTFMPIDGYVDLGASDDADGRYDFTAGLVLMQRNQLDNVVQEGNAFKGNRNFKQLLPYVVFVYPIQENSGDTRVAVYRRRAGVGESRLAGNLSIGFGGHIEISDVQHDEGVIDLPDTLMVAALREIEQEITIVSEIMPLLTSDDLRPVGLIVDGSNDVGNLHLGIVHVAYLSQGDIVTVNEPELEALPATKLSELLACGSPIESWSKLLAGELVKRL